MTNSWTSENIQKVIEASHKKYPEHAFETETIDKLFLELSQFSSAKTERELKLLQMLLPLHEWFLKVSPENYKGCGLCIDVEAMLKREGLL